MLLLRLALHKSYKTGWAEDTGGEEGSDGRVTGGDPALGGYHSGYLAGTTNPRKAEEWFLHGEFGEV